MTTKIAQATLTVKLTGAEDDAGAPRLPDFLSFGDSLAKCLKRIEALVSSQGEPIQYRIVDLHAGSAILTLEAIPPRKRGPDSRKEVITAFQKTVSSLQAGAPVDPRLSFDDLRAFRELVAPLSRHSRGICIGSLELTSQYLANIDRLLTTTIESEGFVTGLLEQINVHNRREFKLYPPVAGFRVTCEFPETLFDQVRRGLKRNVTVSGTLHFHPAKAFPERVNVKTLEILPDNSALPTLAALRGIGPGATGDLTSVEFVRAIRDASEAQD